ncbi:MAG TPA: NADH-quinone oxidoreductase subunit L [Limnobacter sp.]|nr:NADH-quinone oxidoreductase subunit L [Limnobacter sp.]
MDSLSMVISASALAPTVLLALLALLGHLQLLPERKLWRLFRILLITLLVCTVVTALGHAQAWYLPTGLKLTTFGVLMAVLVQLLGTVIGGFSSRYLQGEPGQARYLAALSAVLAAVHLLLIADNWLVLIAAWSMVGTALQHLLCFYPDRAFARLAAHKKKLADVLADGLLIAAASLAWLETGSGSISALGDYVAQQGMSLALQASAMALVLAVILRTALMPVHGWLIQVMEAPTPVSALLHAGVVNLGGFVLIRFAPMLEQAMFARTLLLAFGLATAVLAGMVMLTRISIKVRLAWSTVAQMGFMLLECALGLYTLAALHLMGHSLYKAHAFLAASTVVRQARQEALWGKARPHALTLLLAPVLTASVVFAVQMLLDHTPWPWWWSVMLGLAWAPMLWFQSGNADAIAPLRHTVLGGLMVCALTAAALLAHSIPLGIADTHNHALGMLALLGMLLLYSALVLMQLRPKAIARWQRWSYAGFYVDEIYTRLALRIWPTQWTQSPWQSNGSEHIPRRLQ